jgi:uncharacterized protein YgbK (DUF1537 family)
MTLKLGCIADDFTGGTDLANNLVRAGMRTVQVIGVPDAAATPVPQADAVVVALKPRLGSGPLLVYATAQPDAVRSVQQQLGAERAGALVEQALSRVAAGLVAAGVGQLVVAGGETSGACVQALGISQLRIGPQIDPGVPWCHAATPARPDGLHLALKSGNFGGQDFFSRAFQLL